MGMPGAMSPAVQEWVEERSDRSKGGVQRLRHWQEGAFCLGRVARLPEPSVRDCEAFGQPQAAPPRLGSEGRNLWPSVHRRGEDDGHEVDEVLVAGRRRFGGPVPFEYGADLVRHVINER